MTEPLLVTVAEACRLLSVSDDTVRRLLKTGAIPPARVGGAVRIRTEDLRRYVARIAGAEDTSDAAARDIEETICHENRSERKTAFTSVKTRPTGGRATPAGAGDQLADLLAYRSRKTRKD